MDPKTSGMVSAAAALAMCGAAAVTPAAASGPAALAASAYADLLEPIPNAQTLLIADDQAMQERQAGLQPATFFYWRRWHHHHHHHHWRWYR